MSNQMIMGKNILVIDDDLYINNLLEKLLQKEGYHTFSATKGRMGLEILKDENIDLALCDIRLPDINGVEVLKSSRKISPDTKMIMITAYAEIRTAVETIKLGAVEYVTKPIYPEEILQLIKSHLKVRPKKEPRDNDRQKFIAGESQVMRKVIEQSGLVAPTDMSVLIQGETGSGKEYIARLIHRKSLRKDKKFVAIDCGAIPKELAASELFGHVKGAFTGAISNKSGYFEEANGGTIFLDEIGNLSYETQVKLLRAIQLKVISKVGGIKDIPVDVRILSASNTDLMQAVEDGHFREDLYHRINEFKLTVPPLRERENDIIIFAEHFLDEANRELNRDVRGFDHDVINAFLKYHWYGNLREIRNVVKRSVLIAGEGNVSLDCLPEELKMEPARVPHMDETEADDLGSQLKDAAHNAERRVIMKALQEANFNKTRAARILNIDRKTLYNKIKVLGIDS